MKKLALLLALLLMFNFLFAACGRPEETAAAPEGESEEALPASAGDAAAPVETEPASAGDIAAPAETEPAAPETEPVETEPEEPEETEPEGFVFPDDLNPVLETVLDQYRAACTDADYTPANYPLADPEIVRQVQRRTAYGVAFNFTAFSLDLDGDWEKELLVVGPQSQALYGVRDGEPVMVLSSAQGVKPGESLRVYKNEEGDSLIVRIENDGNTASGKLYVYRYSPEPLAPDEVWSYSFDKTHLPSFRNTSTGKTLECADFWKQFSLNGEGYWAPVGGRDAQTCCLSIPAKEGTEDPALQYVTDVYAVEGELLCSIRYDDGAQWRIDELQQAGAMGLPHILDVYGGDMGRFNDQMLGLAAAAMKLMGVYNYEYSCVVHGDILCIRIHENSPVDDGYDDCYNFSLSEQRELSDDELLARVGVSRSACDKAAENALLGMTYFQTGMLFDPSMYDYVREATVERLSNRQLTLNEDGMLVVYGMVGSFAGASAYQYSAVLFTLDPKP